MPTLEWDGSIAATGALSSEDADGLSTASLPGGVGSNNFDEIAFALTDGTGSEQANNWWMDERTVNATTADNIDLAGSLTNQLGTVVFTAVKAVIIAIDAPDGIKTLRVGPQGVANAFQGWEGGVAAGNYETVNEAFLKLNRYSGWAVTAGTGDVLGIYNPGAGAVTYRIWILGVT